MVILIYDDVSLVNQDVNECKSPSLLVSADILRSGFLLLSTNACGAPSNVFNCYGMRLDTEAGVFKVLLRRLERLAEVMN